MFENLFIFSYPVPSSYYASTPAICLQDFSVALCGIWYHPNSNKTFYNHKKHDARKPSKTEYIG